MCGIAGILTQQDWTDVHTAALQSLQQALRHRGPDDQGLWSDPARGAGLVHTRLAILDLSPAGHQPMRSHDGRYVISFNGEIYNYRELRAELEQAGCRFHGHSDTEVLLNLYATEGPGMLGRLRGMFAFCLWDQYEQSAFLARDPLGIKPLYYAIGNEGLVFASELRALRACPLIPSEVDGTALTRFLETGSVPEPLTMLRAVRCLEAGHALSWKGGRHSMQGYWNMDFSNPEAAVSAVSTTRQALEDSMRAHLVSDVPVGLFLSGGIDSTALLALMKAAGHEQVATFSIGVDEARLDESSLARRTAAHFKTDHHERQLDARAARELFSRFLGQMDQPTIDGFNTFTVADFARREGFKVVLSGLGGDEVFGGYPSFQKVPQLARWARHAQKLPWITRFAGRLMEKHGLNPKHRRLGNFLASEATLKNAYRAFRSVFTASEAARIGQAYGQALETAEPSTTTSSGSDPTEADAVSRLEISLYMRNQLLKDSDVMSMAHGLELRVPFVDRVLIDRLSRLPAETRLRPGKGLLLDAVPEIPEWIRSQPKRGFAFPFAKWLREDWTHAFEKATQRIPFSNPTWYQVWAVFMLEHWLEQKPINT